MKVISQRYGKARVRVMKILRESGTDLHRMKELTVQVMLDGPSFAGSYTEADNSMVVPTDTVKNTINCLAFDLLGVETEPFVTALADHFLNKYAHVKSVEIETTERVWERMLINDQAHPHSFTQAGSMVPWVRLVKQPEAGINRLESGVRDLLILKSTQAGFAGYPKCDYTTLKETTERIVATSLEASWLWSGKPANYAEANANILQAFFTPFAENFSPSVQANLWQMGTAALETVSEISEVSLAAPNKHCLLMDLSAFGRTNEHTLFLPTDEPHGQIEVVVGR